VLSLSSSYLLPSERRRGGRERRFGRSYYFLSSGRKRKGGKKRIRLSRRVLHPFSTFIARSKEGEAPPTPSPSRGWRAVGKRKGGEGELIAATSFSISFVAGDRGGGGGKEGMRSLPSRVSLPASFSKGEEKKGIQLYYR